MGWGASAISSSDSSSSSEPDSSEDVSSSDLLTVSFDLALPLTTGLALVASGVLLAAGFASLALVLAFGAASSSLSLSLSSEPDSSDEGVGCLAVFFVVAGAAFGVALGAGLVVFFSSSSSSLLLSSDSLPLSSSLLDSLLLSSFLAAAFLAAGAAAFFSSTFLTGFFCSASDSEEDSDSDSDDEDSSAFLATGFALTGSAVAFAAALGAGGVTFVCAMFVFFSLLAQSASGAVLGESPSLSLSLLSSLEELSESESLSSCLPFLDLSCDFCWEKTLVEVLRARAAALAACWERVPMGARGPAMVMWIVKKKGKNKLVMEEKLCGEGIEDGLASLDNN